MPEIEPIDVVHMGRERVICCWRVDDVLIDPGPESCVKTLLAALDGLVPRALLLTHIHFDHAGAAGALARRWPDVEIYVHEFGAKHLADPTRLVASARRLYSDFDERWGEVVAVDADRMRVLGGTAYERGTGPPGFAVAATPGHARHHVCYLHEHSGRAFTGDMAGVRIPPSDYVLAPTPPPDIDVEQWRGTLQMLEQWSPDSLAITHFGCFEDVASQLGAVRAWLGEWSATARELDQEEFERRVRATIAGVTDLDTAAVFDQAAPPDQLYLGLRRYWDTRAES